MLKFVLMYIYIIYIWYFYFIYPFPINCLQLLFSLLWLGFPARFSISDLCLPLHATYITGPMSLFFNPENADVELMLQGLFSYCFCPCAGSIFQFSIVPFTSVCLTLKPSLFRLLCVCFSILGRFSYRHSEFFFNVLKQTTRGTTVSMSHLGRCQGLPAVEPSPPKLSTRVEASYPWSSGSRALQTNCGWCTTHSPEEMCTPCILDGKKRSIGIRFWR